MVFLLFQCHDSINIVKIKYSCTTLISCKSCYYHHLDINWCLFMFLIYSKLKYLGKKDNDNSNLSHYTFQGWFHMIVVVRWNTAIKKTYIENLLMYLFWGHKIKQSNLPMQSSLLSGHLYLKVTFSCLVIENFIII